MGPWTYVALAWILLFIEFYLPSGIIATAAGMFLLIACGQAFFVYGAAAGLAFFVGAVVGSGLVVWLAMALIRRSASHNTLYLSSSQEGFVGAQADQSFIGKHGIAVSDLGPSGFVMIHNHRLQAVSEGKYVDKGARVIVDRTQGAYLVVRQL